MLRFVYASLFRSHIRQMQLQIRFGLRGGHRDTHKIKGCTGAGANGT
jgi:hypothetical protein